MKKFNSLVLRAEAAKVGSSKHLHDELKLIGGSAPSLQQQLTTVQNVAAAFGSAAGGYVAPLAECEMATRFTSDCFRSIDDLLEATNAFDTPNKALLVTAVDLYLKTLSAQEAVLRTMASSAKCLNKDLMT